MCLWNGYVFSIGILNNIRKFLTMALQHPVLLSICGTIDKTGLRKVSLTSMCPSSMSTVLCTWPGSTRPPTVAYSCRCRKANHLVAPMKIRSSITCAVKWKVTKAAEPFSILRQTSGAWATQRMRSQARMLGHWTINMFLVSLLLQTQR